jgi:hypothetical protein
MSHTLASADQGPVCRRRTLPPSATRTPRVEFFGGGMLLTYYRKQVYIGVGPIRQLSSFTKSLSFLVTIDVKLNI